MIKDFEKYLLLEKRYSIHTVTAYLNDIKQFYEFCSFEPDFICTDHNYIRNWIVHLMDNNISKRSVNRKISSLKTFYRYLLKQNKIKTNPFARIVTLKTSKNIPEFIPETDFDNFEDLFDTDFKGIRDKLILEILYLTGIRRAELVNLKNSDIDLSKKQIKVTGKRQKQRIIPITDYLAEQIKIYIFYKNSLAQTDKLAFILTDKGSPAYDKFIYRTVNFYLSKMTTLNKKSPHILRHTFATHLLNNGADLNAIKELLGHSNLNATQVYTHNSYEKLNKIYKQAHPRA